jgi:hypothetical protein
VVPKNSSHLKSFFCPSETMKYLKILDPNVSSFTSQTLLLICLYMHLRSNIAVSVVDPHHFDVDPDADPDSTYHPDAGPDSDFLFYADLDSDPSFKKKP